MSNSDIGNLLKRIETLLVAVDLARGTSQELIKAQPLEIHLYNLTTGMKRDLESYQAMLEDCNGTYNIKSSKLN